MRITRIKINNYLGVKEVGIEAGKVNFLKGPKGAGKSSIIEGIEKAFTNTNRRTEVIRHGENESTILIETDTGLEIDRRIREDKADYLKIRQENGAVPSTEKFLRSLINGEIFRPIEWIKKGPKEQTKTILNMLNIPWSMEDIESWFGEEVTGIDYEQHILQVIKAIETKYYKDREEVNKKIKELESQIAVIKKELPPDFDGEKWESIKVQEYYAKVSQAQEINRLIAEQRSIAKSFEDKLNNIEAHEIKLKNEISKKYKEQREDIKDVVEVASARIEKAKYTIENIEANLMPQLQNIDRFTEIQIQEAIQKIREEAETKKESLKKAALQNKEDAKDTISANESKIAVNEQKLSSLDEVEEQEYKNVEDRKNSAIEAEKLKIGKAAEYLETHEEIDIEPLQREADEVAEMQSYLRQWNMMVDIRNNQLSERERYSKLLTERIEYARRLPQELLKSAKMPIDNISVDEKGNIRIGNTLIDGLSEGEQLDLAFRIAKAQAGELKVIAIDGFERLKSDSQKILDEILTDDFQYFITEHTEDTELKIEKVM